MESEKNEEKNSGENRKDTSEHLEKDEKKHILNVKNELYEEENTYLDISTIVDNKFKEISKEDTQNDKHFNLDITEISNSNQNVEILADIPFIVSESVEVDGIDSNEEDNKASGISNNTGNVVDINNNLSNEQIKKLKTLEEKIEEYNERYHKLEETVQEYEDKNHKLVEKRKEYEKIIRDFEEKSRLLEERNEEVINQSKKLKEARKQFMELSKQLEVKKIDLEKREIDLEKLQKTLEKRKFEFEKEKIELEKDKLEFNIEKSDAETKLDNLNKNESIIKTEYEQFEVKEEKKKSGKVEILRDLMKKLSDEGNFESCFLIDEKGMLISEYSNTQLDVIAIGAMFSLISTAVLRAIKSLHLQELEYFKVSSINGEFILKSINIMNYERNFILLAYYDKYNSSLLNIKQIMNAKIIKRIIKSVKKDFYEFGEGTKISWIFDNLEDKIKFLKKKYSTPEKDIEQIRIDLLRRIGIQIKELFEKEIKI